jgi:hypothetical protein
VPVETQPRLSIVPTTLREANAFVVEHHRHHKATRGHRWSLSVEDEDGQVRGHVVTLPWRSLDDDELMAALMGAQLSGITAVWVLGERHDPSMGRLLDVLFDPRCDDPQPERTTT